MATHVTPYGLCNRMLERVVHSLYLLILASYHSVYPIYGRFLRNIKPKPMLRRIFCIDPHIREVTYEPKHVATYGIVPLDWYFAYLHIFAQVYQYQRSGSTPDARKMNVIVNVIDWGYSTKYSITIQYPQHALPSLATTGR